MKKRTLDTYSIIKRLYISQFLANLEVLDLLEEVERDLVILVSGDPGMLQSLLTGVSLARLHVTDHLEKVQC